MGTSTALSSFTDQGIRRVKDTIKIAHAVPEDAKKFGDPLDVASTAAVAVGLALRRVSDR